MKRILIGVGVVAMVAVACAFPALDQINLADCQKSCSTKANTCFDAGNVKVDICLDTDASDSYKTNCLKEQIKAGEACVIGLNNCLADCVQQTQDQLKGHPSDPVMDAGKKD